MTGSTPFGLHRRVFVSEWTLFIRMALNASRIAASRQPGLLEFKAAVRIMTIAAPHRPFQNFVMEWSRELRLNFGVTTRAQLRIVSPQHANR